LSGEGMMDMFIKELILCIPFLFQSLKINLHKHIIKGQNTTVTEVVLE
jgi:hypothetical protein